MSTANDMNYAGEQLDCTDEQLYCAGEQLNSTSEQPQELFTIVDMIEEYHNNLIQNAINNFITELNDIGQWKSQYFNTVLYLTYNHINSLIPESKLMEIAKNEDIIYSYNSLKIKVNNMNLFNDKISGKILCKFNEFIKLRVNNIENKLNNINQWSYKKEHGKIKYEVTIPSKPIPIYECSKLEKKYKINFDHFAFRNNQNLALQNDNYYKYTFNYTLRNN
jgi:hypothetical protein